MVNDHWQQHQLIVFILCFGYIQSRHPNSAFHLPPLASCRSVDHVSCHPSSVHSAAYYRSVVDRCHNAGQIYAIKQRSICSILCVSSSKVDIDEFDAFMNEISEEPSSTRDNVKPHFVEGKAAVGIGGNDGFVYDVNKLKRNLVQESVRGCKQELLVLLGDGRQSESSFISKTTKEDGKKASNVVVPPRWRRDRDDLIEERLAALVQVC